MWQARKHNIEKRVKSYMNPGVFEVIYADEWDRIKRPKHMKCWECHHDPCVCK